MLEHLLEHLAEIAAIDPAAARLASDEMLRLILGWITNAPAKIFTARDVDHSSGLSCKIALGLLRGRFGLPVVNVEGWLEPLWQARMVVLVGYVAFRAGLAGATAATRLGPSHGHSGCASHTQGVSRQPEHPDFWI